MSDSSKTEESIFDAASQLPLAERAEYLSKACGENAALRKRVEALLQSHDQDGAVLDKPAAESARSTIVVSLPVTEKAGDRIGRYKLLQPIGEGGCGVVYMAEQEEPVRRRVALKVIKLGMDTKSVIARFEAERQALAMMDHPNIAKVLDAGATENGRPFFVMELVRGIKITDYCDQNRLSTAERLSLFTQVCNAIQHAHQKGIIHRDIKPSNILVTLHDGVPVPKVIDFGIAKATQGRLTDQTLFTAFEQFIGTPAYMSPEQAEMSGLDIDTRSDIYALGVLLYELLTGRTPFDAKELLQSGLDELRRTIREKEPARPSTSLSTMLAADLTAVAQRRHSDAPKLIHALRGDLDWIVMKALEKDRTRRYETANGLGMDVQRYLSSEPVSARPPSTLYRFQKLARRNKTLFAAAGAGVGALVLGLAISVYLYVQERSALKRAIEAERTEARLRQDAETSAAWSREISRAELLLMHEQYDDAEKIFDKVPPHASLIALYNVFGELHARRAQWASSISNYARVAQFASNDPPAFEALAVLAAQTGDEAAYRHWRSEILQHFGTMQDGATVAKLASDCLILPPAASEVEPIRKLAAFSLDHASRRADILYAQFVNGLFQYRQGNFTEAKDWLQKAASSPDDMADWNRAVQAQVLLAMAQYQTKALGDARATLMRALKLADSEMIKTGNDLHNEWPAWIAAHLILGEAATLMPDVVSTSPMGYVAKEPDWQTSLRKSGMTVTFERQDDGTWEVGFDDQPFSDLSVLRGLPVTRVTAMHTSVADLSPLRGMQIRWLRLGGTKVSDLGPLQGMPMESLQISGTPVADLSPLRGMPLKTLNMTDCANITDLEPLFANTNFQNIILPPKAKNFEFLRALPGMKRLSFRYDKSAKGPAQTAAEFWAEQDKAKSSR